ncbi:protein RER1-like [Zophobas morio]|uniref:protein RER1-like n=1 Tax=Zophobas morio TaxID=2755281 RepID=UPI0030831844
MEVPEHSDNLTGNINTRYQILLDNIVPYVALRWGSLLFTLGLFFFRIILLQGWYVVCYALSIYLLNLLLEFLTPLDFEFDEEDEGEPQLPTQANQEFKPFVRKLPEFKFWENGMKGLLVAHFCVFFDCFNVPVFWPILVLYFFALFFAMMRKRIQHMIKYKYVPFNFGKKSYRNSPVRTI